MRKQRRPFAPRRPRPYVTWENGSGTGREHRKQEEAEPLALVSEGPNLMGEPKPLAQEDLNLTREVVFRAKWGWGKPIF